MIKINNSTNYKCNKYKDNSHKENPMSVWYTSATSCFKFRNINLGRSYSNKDQGTSIFKYKSIGQASIEFVLILPIIIIIIIGVSQLGYYIYCKNILAHAAREGARVLATTNSNSLAIQQIQKNCNDLEIQMLDININPFSEINRFPGSLVEIDISYKYGGIGDFLTIIMGRDIFIKGTCLIRMEC